MTAPNVKPPAPHEAALLLPWYLNGTLAEPERRLVAEHLVACEECRSELAMTEELRRRMQAMLAEAPSPSASLRAQVMRRLAEQRHSSSLRAPARALGSALAPVKHTRRPGFAGFLRRLLQPDWAPAAAALLILVQAGAISWLAFESRPRPSTSDGQITTRSVEPAAATRIRIVFNPRAVEADIRAALQALGGRIVDGPGEDAAYVIQLPAESPAVIAQRLRELRERPGLIERIENVQ